MESNQALKIYKRWQSALDRANIPVSERSVSMKDLCKKMSGNPENVQKISDAIFNGVETWGQDGICFIIDGDGAADGRTPAETRRTIGYSILQNGITYACQSADYCPPYGIYVDYKRAVSNIMDKQRSLPFVDKLCEQAFLFISEIYISNSSSQIMRDIMAFKMDEIIRRRKDEGLVTILSFSRPCIEILKPVKLNENDVIGPDRYGEEIMNMVNQCGKNRTSSIKDLKLVRVST